MKVRERLVWILWYAVFAGISTSQEYDNESLVIAHETRYSPGQYVQGYVLDGQIVMAGYYQKQKYWNQFPFPMIAIENGSTQSVSTWKQPSEKPETCIRDASNTICLDEYIFRGGHGDIWRAHKIDYSDLASRDTSQENSTLLILKRMRTHESDRILRCAMREIHFGKILEKSSSFPRFVNYFVHEGDHWLVFEDEGSSLHSYLYNSGISDSRILNPSRAWRKLRSSEIGAASMKSIMFQLISNVDELHRMGIVHRDVKPSNILLQASRKPRLLVSDFSSAIDKLTLSPSSSMYGTLGPSISEETLDYAPPEVILSMTVDAVDDASAAPYDPVRPTSYDIWSIGMVFLEIILGTPDVFHVDQRTEALILQLLQKRRINSNTILKKKAFLLAGLSDFGIFDRDELFQDSHDIERKPSSRRKSFSQMVVAAAATFISQNSTMQMSASTVGFADSLAASLASLPESRALTYAAAVEKETTSTRRTLGPCSLSSSKSKALMSSLSDAILHRDILGIGFPDQWGLDLLGRLLCFDPLQRISLSEALNHAYFHGPYVSAHDGEEFATLKEMIFHNQQFKTNKVSIQSISSTQVPSDASIDRDDDIDKNDDIILIMDIDSEDQITFGSSRSLNNPFNDRIDIDLEALEGSSFDANFEVSKTSGSSSALLVQSRLEYLRYQCSKCGRIFEDRLSCTQHMQSRRHGKHCMYVQQERLQETQNQNIEQYNHVLSNNEKLLSELLPPCLSDRSFGLRDEGSGWCDLQGKRRYMEDFHAIHHHRRAGESLNYTLFAVFDGHSGSFAARYSAHHLMVYFQEYLDDIIRYPEIRDDLTRNENFSTTSKEALAVHYAFLSIDHDLSTAYTAFGDSFPIGGTTATALIIQYRDLLASTLLVGHIGDSRLVLCKWAAGTGIHSKKFALQVTSDHSTSNPQEIELLNRRGGNVVNVDGIPRVQGDLIVTRSLGDSSLGPIISSIPDIHNISLHPLDLSTIYETKENFNRDSSCVNYFQFLTQQYDECMSSFSDDLSVVCYPPKEIGFAILASDGLWDVMSNEEAVSMVCDYFLENQQIMKEYFSFKSSHAGKLFNFEDEDFDDGIDDVDEDMHFLDIFQAASRLLAYEAIVRDSMDNIGVSVIDLSHI